MRFVVITGLSGAGKTEAVRSLEDLGFFCVDNLPPVLISKFAELCYQTVGKIDKIALVIDIRGGEFFNELLSSLDELENEGIRLEILFLEASEEALVKRFKESRRRHPLAPEDRVLKGIEEERERLGAIRQRADYIIDTTNLRPRQLKEELANVFQGEGKKEGLLVSVVSFGFKHGIPLDADLIFDVRFLPNPYYNEVLRDYSGENPAVKEYVMRSQDTKKFLAKLHDLMEFLIPNYIREGKSNLVVGIGCTGGRHRSVIIANALHDQLKRNNHRVITDHRDIGKSAARDENR
ncbi:MAG: RNase adapter RapZ [Bacillota bacterium]|nr:RNase adapter RapZ [Bacillota bacterium]MDD3297812.1 RNase adapter RapZ [Bacillota bacterium]MDD3850821.1 RNase adapter RapZ [Bacillota bacterium]MDD4707515.1 RNase adapter RapZ [Bacillota bacterium]